MSQSAQTMLGARRDQMFPTMERADIGRLHRFGESKYYEAGERIVKAGHVAPGLVVILSGKVEVTQGCGTEQREIIVTHLPGQFCGELAQLSARPSLVNAEAVEPVHALVIRSDRLRDLLVQEAELGERIMRALILRRVFAGKRRERADRHWTRKSCGRVTLAGVSRPQWPASSRTRFRQRFLCEDLD